MSSLLFGVSPTDGVTFAVVSGSLVLVAAAVSWIPAWGAAWVDPTVVLSEE